ncbi:MULTISPECIES: pyridoxamine 5'-phosphate oxidase family protein [Streptomyces]|uniref:pyridoxamine 5'-phosphate oxidase family protein n=1 Tax=Streptomyces TaxID=1883 RepID=UPI001D0AF739|nr:pyridoxamine 5'-phosphate oxidase family protein [Streptomyces longhuiensis]UDM03742.1 pyridoxamine 5'-phosphate oxidase family protein [Streptomyces longhuiensis]
MPLPLEEREAFLAEPRIGALAVARAQPGRAPLTVPIWYWYEPGGSFWFMTGRDSAKAKAVRAAGRISLMAERVEPTVRYVTVEGSVTSEAASTVQELTDLAARYLPADKVEGYVKAATAEHGAQVTFHIRPAHWLSADLGSV